MPLFCKPGKHNYFIKYKDESEMKQKQNVMRKRKQEKRYKKAKKGLVPDKPFDKKKHRKAKAALKPEVFFYKCEVPPRQEEIPTFSKNLGSKVQVRAFDYESSLWNKWRRDTPESLARAFEMDRALWKGFRFIKLEDEVSIQPISTNLLSLLTACSH